MSTNTDHEQSNQNDEEWFACGCPREPGQRGIKCSQGEYKPYIPGLSTQAQLDLMHQPPRPGCTKIVSPNCARSCMACGGHFCKEHISMTDGGVLLCWPCKDDQDLSVDMAREDRRREAEERQYEQERMLRNLGLDSDSINRLFGG